MYSELRHPLVTVFTYSDKSKKVFAVTDVTCFLKSSADQLLVLNGRRFNYFWCFFFFLH